jgi:transposase-like protein
MTDDEDICGHPTDDGTPCQHPATDGESCWIPAHGGNAEDHGRPSTLEEYEEDILVGARQGMTLEGCARLAGIDESTLHRWIDKYDDFRKSLKRARAQGELQHLQSVNDRGSQFILERSFGYVKTEKRELEHSGDVDIETEVVIGGDQE